MQEGYTTGHILEIQRMSTEDGPGLRTTLFLKGCPLHCPWCHNPESISSLKQLQWFSVKCIGCHTCIKSCPDQALSVGAQGEIMIDRGLCTSCGICAESCPTQAMSLIGYYEDSLSITEELLKDRAYFTGATEGGVTISGGEALLQAPFVAEVFSSLQAQGISTALDTCGVCSSEALKIGIEAADIILFDLKLSDPITHAKLVGGELTVILTRLRQVLERGKRVWIRTPIIPGFTDSDENIRGLALILSDLIGQYGEQAIERWELCAFNDLCADKYKRLGIPWLLAESPLMSEERMEYLVSVATEAGISTHIVSWTGMTKKGEENHEADV